MLINHPVSTEQIVEIGKWLKIDTNEKMHILLSETHQLTIHKERGVVGEEFGFRFAGITAYHAVVEEIRVIGERDLGGKPIVSIKTAEHLKLISYLNKYVKNKKELTKEIEIEEHPNHIAVKFLLSAEAKLYLQLLGYFRFLDKAMIDPVFSYHADKKRFVVKSEKIGFVFEVTKPGHVKVNSLNYNPEKQALDFDLKYREYDNFDSFSVMNFAIEQIELIRFAEKHY